MSRGSSGADATGFELALDGGFTRPLSSRVTRIGRGPGNDIVLSDAAVSGHHGSAWTDGKCAYVQDLGSRNGIFVNGVRVVGIAQLTTGDRVSVGETEMVVQAAAAHEDTAQGLLLEDIATGVGGAIARERLRLGDAPGVDLRVPGAAEVVVFVRPNGALELGVDDDTRPLAPGEPFQVGERWFVVRRDVRGVKPTVDLGGAAANVILEATLEGGPGPRSLLRELTTNRTHVVAAENRATLLWLLARQRVNDLAEGRAEAEAGWCAEQGVLTSVWGRALGGTPANLRVLVCRIRRELREAGFDPWMLEHHNAHLRMAAVECVVR